MTVQQCTWFVFSQHWFHTETFVNASPVLAFAITTHKTQGLSIRTTIVDTRSTKFGPGMIYVALSRVTSLSGLHLIDLDKLKIICDPKAVDKYNRLLLTLET